MTRHDRDSCATDSTTGPVPLSLWAPEPDPVIVAAPGGPVIDTAEGQHGNATATFSADRRWRFRLSRVWDAQRGRVVFCMLNPSTADAFKVDRTVNRCLSFARQWGFGACEIVNCFAWRSPYPRDLRTADDPVGDGNDAVIAAAARAADLVVAAWGVHAVLADREAQVRRVLRQSGCTTVALTVTKAGHPGHPLYLPADTAPAPFVA